MLFDTQAALVATDVQAQQQQLVCFHSSVVLVVSRMCSQVEFQLQSTKTQVATQIQQSLQTVSIISERA